jgi:hypothetical protein
VERRAASLAFLSTVQDGEAARSPEAPSAGQTEVWSCWLEVEGRVLALSGIPTQSGALLVVH